MANIFSKIGQAWNKMPLQNKLYMGTMVTDKLAGSYNFGGLGLAMAGAAMKLDGQPGSFSSKGGGTKPSTVQTGAGAKAVQEGFNLNTTDGPKSPQAALRMGLKTYV